MSQPLPRKEEKSSFFSSQPAIRIPTFQSPTVKAAPAAPIAQTRDEERQARLKAPAGAWNNLHALLPKGPQPLPSFGKRLASTAPAPGSPSKKAKTPRKIVAPTPPSRRSAAEGTSASTNTTARRASGAAHASASKASKTKGEVQKVVSRAKQPATSDSAARRKSAPRASAAPGPAPAPAPAPAKKRKSSLKAPPLPPPIDEPEEEDLEPPVASTSTSATARKGRKSAAAPVEKKAAAPSAKNASKKRARTPEVEEEEDSDDAPEQMIVRPAPRAGGKATSTVSKPKTKAKPAAPPKPKRVRISDVPLPSPARPAPVETYSDASADEQQATDSVEDGYEQQLDVEEEESEESEAEGGRRRKGVKVTTERLKGNKGRLNAVDVVYGGVKKVLGRKLAALSVTSTLARSLSRYSTTVQTHLLTRSDQLSTLSFSASAVAAARSKARALRLELLGVQRARAGVGKRMREEEGEWRESRKRGESTRSLHEFLNDLSAASLDWQDAPPSLDGPNTAETTTDQLQPRLERLAALLGSNGADLKGKGKKGKKQAPTSGGLLARVQRLNGELRMERL